MLLLTIVLLTLALGCAPASKDAATQEADGSTHEAEVLAYRQAREERLRQPQGWLTLVGLHWLREGPNTFGSDPGNRVVFPEGKAPASAGAFHVGNGQVRVEAEPGAAITHDGRPVANLALQSDAAGEPTILEMGSLQFYLIDRTGQLGIRVRDTESEVLASFEGLDYYPIHPAWRITARFEPYDTPRSVKVPNIIGTVFDEPSSGALVLDLEGRTFRLDALPNGANHLLVFGDTTNGSETYGGGRFLELELPQEAGPVVLDFNKTYNPPCVFTPYATCPLPPANHRLPVAIRAGERGYTGVGH